MLLACLAAWLWGGCSDTYLSETDAEGYYPCTISLKTAPSVEVETRAAINENEIHDVWVIQLAMDGSDTLAIPPRYFTANQMIVSSNSITIRTFLKQTPTTKFILLANTGDASLFDTSAAPSTIKEADIVAKCITHSGDWKEKLGYIPMSSTWDKPESYPYLELAHAGLIRAMARLTVKLSVDIPAGDALTLSSMQLKNVPQTLQYWREDLDVKNPSVDSYPAPNTPFGDYAPITTNLAGSTTTWWMPENCRGTGSGRFETDKVAAAIANGDKATYLEIKGKYQGKIDVTYRFYLGGNNTNDYNVRRNTDYTYNITLKGMNKTDMRVTIETQSFSSTSNGTATWGDGGSETVNGSI